jgi:hypothetical protein|tara:strand:- start:608 stop:895 length:288 start_codon:yes stop_codon:yes gene_type:complete
MIDVINDKLVLIDDMGNMAPIEDEAIKELYVSMKQLLGDINIIEEVKEVEPIYSYIVEKIYTMPDYIKWNEVPFKDKPKEKLAIAFNKFIHDKIN